MNVIKTDIDGVVIIEPKVFGDHRGYFFESFSQRDFNEQVREVKFVQDNESKSCYGVLRGLHFQKPPHAQSKLVRVVKGAVLDVAVDIPQVNGIGGIVTYNWVDPFNAPVPWQYKGSWNWYLGVGAAGGFYGLFNDVDWKGAYVGVAGQVGIAYDFWFPLQLSLDYRPNIGVHFGDNVRFNDHGFYGITLGIRYRF